MIRRLLPNLLDGIFGKNKSERRGIIPREVEREIADHFEACSLGRCISSSEDYNIDRVMEDYINFIYCTLLLQYQSSIDIEVDEFMEDFNKLKALVTSKIENTCSDPLLSSRIREFNEETLINYENLAEDIYKRYEGSKKKIMSSYREIDRKVRGKCELDIPFRENSLKNKRLAVSYLWKLFSTLKAFRLSEEGRDLRTPIHQSSL